MAAAVLAAAAGSSTPTALRHDGDPVRWVMLAVLLAFSLVRALPMADELRFPRRTALLLAAFCGLSLVSTTWSVNGRGTLERAVAQPVAVLALGLLAACAAARPVLGERLLDGVLAAAVVVATAGFVFWLADPARAASAVTFEYPSRYQGIEQSPNTAPLLLAIALPVALWRLLSLRRPVARVLLGAIVLGFVASIAASGSRGALAAAFVAAVVVLCLARKPRLLRGFGAAAAVGALVVSAWAMTLPKPLPGHDPAPPTLRETRNAELILPLEQEIGNPWWTHGSRTIRRSLLATSVRLRALDGTVERAAERPLLGYGFGAEQWAFVNRYFGFASQNPENGYVGIFLQLGAIGLALWLAVLALCILPGVRRLVSRRPHPPYVLGAVGAAAGVLAMALSQSYFHGVGGIGYVAMWTALLLGAVAGAARAEA